MSPSQWGPSIWTLFHTLIEKSKEESYAIIGSHLYSFIYQICMSLPCDVCTQHAKNFLSKVNVSQLKTKTDLKNLIYVFHNAVNSRKRMPLYKYTDLEIYKTKNVIHTFNEFARNYHTNGNMKLISENFHRKLILSNMKKWLMQHILYFD